MRILCVLGRHGYGDPARGEGYEHRNFLPALQALGAQVEVFDSFSRLEYADFSDLNRRLLHAVVRFEPDIVLCVLMGYEIWLETLHMIRNSVVALVNWGTDDSWKYREFTRFVAPAFDRWATTSHTALEAARRDGLRSVVLSQWAASSRELATPLPARECAYPVSFVGSAYGNRRQWISRLKARGIDVACFGHGWGSGPVAAEELPKIIRNSVLSLNFADSGLVFQGLTPHRSRQLKARVFEVPGAGGCLLTQPSPELEAYYAPGEEIVVFRNEDDLAESIHSLLVHPDERDRLALAGHTRTAREHTYEARFRRLLADLDTGRQRRPLELASFESIAARHRLGPGLEWARKILAAPFEWRWGKPRGTRAARRLLFELSWRLAGSRTYEAAGLPGRLFYRES